MSQISTYQIGRMGINPLFQLLYHPTIINNEIVPQKGPLVLCGSHDHVWDQVPVICSAKRTIHWMAKKEYFDSSMGWFYQFMECIPVDRKGNSHDSYNQAIDKLGMGHAIGIFPEGTRNRPKEDVVKNWYQDYTKENLPYDEFRIKFLSQNIKLSQLQFLENLVGKGRIDKKILQSHLFEIKDYLKELEATKEITLAEVDNALLLPFYPGAVKMACEKNAVILPFSVIGDFKLGIDNVVARYGDPYVIGGDDIEQANKELRGKILTLVKENEKELH